MKKTINSKHSRSIFIFALLSLFMCMAAGKASAAERNPVVKIDNTSYTSSGTEVTLRLWMFNWKYVAINPKQYNARFTGDVSLYIDDKEVGKLNSMWVLISGSSYTFLNDTPGTVGKSSDINLDGTNVGTAQFQDFKSGQTYPYNSNTTDKSWSTVDLKLSFNKSFTYYGHKITVKGKWQDQGSGSVVTKDVALDNTINGFVRPVNLSAQPSGDNMVFSWEQQGYNPSASTLGKWIVYKREGDNNVKLGEVATNEHSLSIEKKQYSCSNDYIMTFLPNVCKGEETVCGLTTTIAATGHQLKDDICQICGHSFFRYHTSDGNKVDISKRDFGANVVSHEVVDGECVIEFDTPITRIPRYTFHEKKLVGELRIPNTVMSIQDYAFNNCTGLTGNLVIPNSVTEIGNEAFYNCKGLNGTLTLSNNLKTIGKSAFYNCLGFKGSLTLPNSVTTIGVSAFERCSGFTSLKLSDALSVIPSNAFERCTSLSGILVIPNSVTEIGNFAFRNCTGFNGTLTLSSNLKTIKDRAFCGCSKFTGSLTLPNSVTTIGIVAFEGCSGFTNLTLSNALSVIPERAFFKCTSLSGNLVIPNSVTEIGDGAFYYCKGFNGTLTLLSKLKTIGKEAFYSCSGFTGALTFHESVTAIGADAFYDCPGFKGSLTLPNSVTTIGESAFAGCSGFTNLKLSDALSAIPNSAFNGCTNLSGELVIPASVTEIGMNAFQSYTNLNKDSENPSQVTLPESLEKIGKYAFNLCDQIKTVNFQSLPEGISEYLGNSLKKAVSLSDDSYISDMASDTVNEISYTRTMTSNWGTLVLPYSLTLTGEEPYRLYTIDKMDGEELVLSRIEGTVAAGTPCVVKRNGSEAELTFGANKAALNMAIDGKPVGDMTFRGTYTTEEVNSGYVISKNSFWNVEELKGSTSVKGVKVNPFRAWLDGTSAKAPAQLSICIDGSTTGIDAIDALNDAEAEYYDLSGKRLDEPQRGVNIVRMKSGKTKKIIIK